MKKITLLLIVFIAGFALNVSAQFGSFAINVASGDLKFLKGATDLKIEYNYDGMMVGSMKEEDYIVKHMAEMNKKKPGTGEEWKVKWVADREKKFQPGFEKFFIKELKKAKITVSPTKSDATYTMIVKTIKTEPGLYTGVSLVAKKTFIDVNLIFVETAKPDVEVCRISGSNFIGDAGDFASYDVSLRIYAAYMNCARRMGGYITKALKKMK